MLGLVAVHVQLADLQVRELDRSSRCDAVAGSRAGAARSQWTEDLDKCCRWQTANVHMLRADELLACTKPDGELEILMRRLVVMQKQTAGAHPVQAEHSLRLYHR